MKAKGIIFDVDGSLYKFDRGAVQTFEQSALSRTIRENVIAFFQSRFGLSRKQAITRFEELNFQSNGELSVWLEKMHGIPRVEYFAETWDMDPRLFMDRDDELVASLGSVAARRAVLSNAPRVWIDRVLGFLEVSHIFEPPAIFSGEPDIRKPHPSAFMQVAEFWNLAPEAIVAIGDQEESDILPAKALGMQTVRLGKNVQSAADFVAEDMTTAIELLTRRKII
ncbi:MAG TPA: HAD family hydrolase [Candidatus Pristimantibacillus sp.]|nr:HAD family hydrolase [Candidatus Pristimantibacillus sp.]